MISNCDEEVRKNYPHLKQVKGEDLCSPINISSDVQYLRRVDGAFYDYMLILEMAFNKNKNLGSEFVKQIRKLFDNTVFIIKESFKKAISGEMDVAISSITSFVQNNSASFIRKLGTSYSIKCNQAYYMPNTMAEGVYLFRARKKCDNEPIISRINLFHIPFDRRCFVSSQRFSVPGLPCLYLASNSYVAINEIESLCSPNIFVSAFQPSEKLLNENIVDLTIPDTATDAINGEVYGPKGITKLDNYGIQNALKMAPAHLLNIACSVRCGEDGRSFKSEYVIPQLIMYSLKKLGCCGVAYDSCCISGDHHILRSCFAFPAFEPVFASSSISKKLKNSFLMTEGVNYSYYSKKRLQSLETKKRCPNLPDNQFSKNYADESKDLFCSFYNKQEWAQYEENLPYYKTTNFAFDEFLINSRHFMLATDKTSKKDILEFKSVN